MKNMRNKKYWLFALFCLVLTTSAMIPNIFARYTTHSMSSDSARVAYCSVDNKESTVTFYDADGEVLDDGELNGVSIGVHGEDKVRKIVYEMQVEVKTEVALSYTVQIAGLPAGGLEGLNVTLDDGSVQPTVSEDKVTYYFECGTLYPSANAVTVKHTVTFTVDFGNESTLEDTFPFKPEVQILFTQVGGNAS